MPIIILADIPDPNSPNQGIQAPPAPVVEAPPAPTPAPAPAKRKPVPAAEGELKELDTVADDKFYGELNNLMAAFKQSGDDLTKEQVLRQVYNYPFGGSTIGGYFLYKVLPLMNATPDQKAEAREDAKSEVMFMIWKALEKTQPGGKIIGTLKNEFLATKKKIIQERSSGNVEGGRFTEAKGDLDPYFETLRNPAQVGHNAKPVDPDILQKVEAGQLPPWVAAFEQFKRDKWGDVPDESGVGRIERSKQAIENAVRDIVGRWKPTAQFARPPILLDGPKAVFPIGDDRGKLSVAKQFLQAFGPEHGVDVKPFMKKGPYFLSEEMVTPRKTDETLKMLWDKTSQGNVSAGQDGEERGNSEGPYAYNPSTEEGNILNKVRDNVFTEEDRRKSLENSPFAYLEHFEDRPALKNKIEQRMPIIMPFVPKKDKMGNPVMEKMVGTDEDGSKKIFENPAYEKNKDFSKAISTVVDNLYGPQVPSDRLFGRSMDAETAERTKQVLHAVGKYYIQSAMGEDQVQLQKALHAAIGPLLEQPLAIRHTPSDMTRSFTGQQKLGLAFRDVMVDMMEYLANNKYYNELVSQVGKKAVAAAQRFIRTAEFTIVAKIIAEAG